MHAPPPCTERCGRYGRWQFRVSIIQVSSWSWTQLDGEAWSVADVPPGATSKSTRPNHKRNSQPYTAARDLPWSWRKRHKLVLWTLAHASRCPFSAFPICVAHISGWSKKQVPNGPDRQKSYVLWYYYFTRDLYGVWVSVVFLIWQFSYQWHIAIWGSKHNGCTHALLTVNKCKKTLLYVQNIYGLRGICAALVLWCYVFTFMA